MSNLLVLLLLVVGELIIWAMAAGAIDQNSKRQAFLLAKDDSSGYLIPMRCSGIGTLQRDYIIGYVAKRNSRNATAEACLYNRRSFNRRFPWLAGTAPKESHEAQAARVGTDYIGAHAMMQ